MMDWQELKALKEKDTEFEKAFWKIIDPKNEGIIHSQNPFVRELQELCNSSDSYTASALRLEHYEDQENKDNKTLQELEEEMILDRVNFKKAFIEFVQKYSKQGE